MTCGTHPTYDGDKRPRTSDDDPDGCQRCWAIWWKRHRPCCVPECDNLGEHFFDLRLRTPPEVTGTKYDSAVWSRNLDAWICGSCAANGMMLQLFIEPIEQPFIISEVSAALGLKEGEPLRRKTQLKRKGHVDHLPSALVTQ